MRLHDLLYRAATGDFTFSPPTHIRMARAAIVEFEAAARPIATIPCEARERSFMGIAVVEDLRMPADIGIVERGDAGFRLFHPSTGRFVEPWISVIGLPNAQKVIVESDGEAPVTVEIGTSRDGLERQT